MDAIAPGECPAEAWGPYYQFVWRDRIWTVVGDPDDCGSLHGYDMKNDVWVDRALVVLTPQAGVPIGFAAM